MRTKRASTMILGLLLTACGTNTTVISKGPSADLALQGRAPGTPERDAPTARKAAHGRPDTIAPTLPYPTGSDALRRRKLPILTPPRQTTVRPKGAGDSHALSPLSLGDKSNVVALKVLVISAGTQDPGYDTARAILSQQAIPFDVLDATTTALTEQTLVADDGSGKYQGVVLTTGGLGYESSPNVWDSALTWDEWNLLWNYEKVYQVRQVALYSYPGTYPEDYGIRAVAGAEGDWNRARVTPDGKQVFPDLNATDIPVGDDPAVVTNTQYRKTVWNYPSMLTAVTGLTTTPLLTDRNNNVLAVQSNTSDGRERVALTMDQNPYLLHSQLFSYGLLNWLTKGLYIGELRRYLQVDVDDWFLADDVWIPTSDHTGSVQSDPGYRLSASDALAVRDQQAAVRKTYPVAGTFKLSVAFNAGGADVSAPNTCTPSPTSVDPLASVSRCLYNTFDWFNHSRDHLSMDFVPSYSVAYTQWQGNQNRASKLGLTYSPSVAVSGEHSGLGWYNQDGLDYNKTDYGLGASNSYFLNGAYDASIRYLRSNRGVASQYDQACPNSCGLQHPMKNLFLVPAWPTNIFYYATKPDEVVSSYNAIYGPDGSAPAPTVRFDHNFTYQEILAKETEIAMNHVLIGSMFPHYLHQTNLRQYQAGKSLVFDWVNAVLSTYSTYSTLPLRTLPWKELGPYVKQRTAFVKAITPSTPGRPTPCCVTGTWDRVANTITLTSPTALTASVTGTRAGTSVETYGPTVISRVALTAGTPTTFTIQK